MATALLVLDMQNDFFATPEKRADYPRLLAALNALIHAFEGNGGSPVFNVVSEHKADRSTWSQNMRRENKARLLEGSREAAVVDDLVFGVPPVRIVKTRHSAFVRTDLEAQLRCRGVERVVVAGVFTHGCVAYSAMDAWNLDFEVVVAADCVFSHRPDLAASCVERLQSVFRIELLSNAAIAARWLGGGNGG